MRKTFLVFTLSVLVGCGSTQPSLTDARPKGKTLVPAPEVRGLFRAVCLSQTPRASLKFPFIETEQNTFKHADFDLEFKLSEEGARQICKMTANLREVSGKRSDKPVQATPESRDFVLRDLRSMSPGTKTSVREDGYVIATTELN